MKTVKSVLIASTILAASSLSAFAAPALGLVGDKTLVLFDTDKPTVTKTMDVTGVTKLVGIDLRSLSRVRIERVSELSRLCAGDDL